MITLIFLLTVTAFSGSSSSSKGSKKKTPTQQGTQVNIPTQHNTTASAPRDLRPGESPGFRNLGNTCFMNSALQSLFALKPFREGLKGYLGKERKPWVKLLHNFKQSWKTTTPASPLAIRDKMREDMELNRDSTQEDAKEFLQALLQPRLQPRTGDNSNSKLRMPNKIYNMFDPGFHGSYIPDALVIPEDNDGHTLEELLHEAHNNNYNKYTHAPDILVFSLGIFQEKYWTDDEGKFQSKAIKKLNKINIRENLNMKEYIWGETSNQLYRLKAVIYHSGLTIHSGHYFAHVKENGKWVEKNDEISKELHDQTKANRFLRKEATTLRSK
jgi:uncharacterized UBP type Zn finger protein